VDDFEIGQFLRSVRKSLSLSTHDVEELSKEGGPDRSVSASQLSRIETGQTANPGFRVLQNIAAALGIPLIIVLDGSQANVDRITVLSTQDVSRSLYQALQRPELMELLIECRELTHAQLQALLDHARSYRRSTEQ
jgi:transcriptional regulator with XRE-family HTH domain